jgi:hypothetical protein
VATNGFAGSEKIRYSLIVGRKAPFLARWSTPKFLPLALGVNFTLHGARWGRFCEVEDSVWRE